MTLMSVSWSGRSARIDVSMVMDIFVVNVMRGIRKMSLDTFVMLKVSFYIELKVARGFEPLIRPAGQFNP